MTASPCKVSFVMSQRRPVESIAACSNPVKDPVAQVRRLVDDDRRCLAAVHDDLRAMVETAPAHAEEIQHRIQIVLEVVREHLRAVGVHGSDAN